MVLMATPEVVAQQVEAALQSYGTPAPGEGHVFNLGHGISRFTPPENVTAMVETVHAYSRLQRSA